MRLRSLSVGAVIALAASVVVAVPGTAQAAALTSGTHQAGRSVNEAGPATCAVANPVTNDAGTFSSDGVTSTRTVSGTAVVTDTGDAGDVTSVATTSTSRVRATEAGGQLASLSIDLSIATTMTAAQGFATDCDPQANGFVAAAYETVLTTGRWVVLDAALPSGSSAQVIFSRTAPSAPPTQQIIVLTGTAKGRAHAEFFLPAGTYGASATMSHSFTFPQTAGPTSFSIRPTIDASFRAPGSAVTAPDGGATSYVKLKSDRDCATGQLKGRFLKAAGTKKKPTVKKAVFKVNGVKSKVVKKVAKGGKVTLKNLPADRNVEVVVTLKLVGGGSERLTAEYFSCT
jgi:hypothetical protein